MALTGPMDAQEKQIVAYTSASHLLVHVLELSFAAVLVNIGREFGSGLFALGLIANIAALAFGTGALPAGVLSDRIGARRLLTICFLGAALFCFLVSLSSSIWLLGASLVGLGAAIGLYHPGGLAFISQGVRLPTKSFAYHGMAGNIGVALAPLLGGAVAALVSWRALYFMVGVAALVLAGVIFFFAPRHQNLDRGEVKVSATAPSSASLRQVWLPLLLLYTANTFTGFIYRGTVTFLPLYMRESIHISFFNIDAVAVAGSFTTMARLFGIAGQYVGGALAAHMRLERMVVTLSAILIPALLLMGLTGELSLVFFASVFAFFNFMGQPIFNSLIAKYTPFHLQGRSYGISFFCAFGLGSFSAGFSGFIAERAGANWVFIALAGAALLLFGITALFLKVSASVPFRATAFGVPRVEENKSATEG